MSKLRLAIVASILVLAASAMPARTKVGRIVIDSYQTRPWESNTKGPGARIVAHFEPNAEFAKQDCCKLDDLRWLQRLSATSGIPGVTPIPNRPMIDLRPGQIAPGSPTGRGDDLPMYDFTYPSLEDVEKNKNIKVDGSGKFMTDVPRVAAGQLDLTVRFTTLVVCLNQEEKVLCALGGFKWGFKVDGKGKSTLLPIEALRDDVIGLGKFTDFSVPLRDDFPDWRIGNQRSCCGDNQSYFEVVTPEPNGGLALASMLLVVIRRRRCNSTRASRPSQSQSGWRFRSR